MRGAEPQHCWRGRPLVAAAAATVVLALSGCGADDERPRRDPNSAGRLRALLGEVRGAAEAGDRSRALAAIRRFEVSVGRFADRGELDDADLRALRLGAQRVERRIQLNVSAPEPPAAPPAPTPQPSPQPEAKQPKPKKPKPSSKRQKEPRGPKEKR